jgi:hypothetical protein
MSPQKHAAQIANAKLSHGPVTEAGRLRSSSNSTRHGLASSKLRIIPPEDRDEFDQLCSEMLPALAPEGPIENHLADLIVFDEWRRIRIRGLENEIFAMGSMTAKDQFFAGAETWLAKSKELATLTLYEQRITRVLTRNKAEFEARQSARKARGAESGADLLVCADSPSAEASLAEPAESKLEAVASAESLTAPESAPETVAGFVRSSVAMSLAPDAELPNPPLETTPKQPELTSKWLQSAPVAAPIPQGALRNAA